MSHNEGSGHCAVLSYFELQPAPPEDAAPLLAARHLSRFDRIDRMTREEDLWEIPEYLAGIPHIRLLPPNVGKRLSPVDRRMFEAGLVGRCLAPTLPARQDSSKQGVSDDPTL